MRGVNKVILVGTLEQDPEVKSFSNGNSLTQFSIATSEQWTDKNTGERKEMTEWHRIVANGAVGKVCADYLKKGSKVYVEGSIRTRKYQQDGVDKFVTEIRLDQMQMLDSKPADGGQQRQAAPQQRQPVQAQYQAADLDDALPF